MTNEAKDYVFAVLARQVLAPRHRAVDSVQVVREAHELARETCRQFGHVPPDGFEPDPIPPSQLGAMVLARAAEVRHERIAARLCQRCGGSLADEAVAKEWRTETARPERAEVVRAARAGMGFRQIAEPVPSTFYRVEIRLPYMGNSPERIDVDGTDAAVEIAAFCRAYLEGAEFASQVHPRPADRPCPCGGTLRATQGDTPSGWILECADCCGAASP